MKKRILKTVCGLLLLTMSIGVLSSCSVLLKIDHLLMDPATHLFFEANVNMAEIDSYSTETTLTFSGKVMGSELEAFLLSTSLYYDQYGDEFTQQIETQSTVKVDGISQGTIITYNGFQDGKMYTAYKENGKFRQKLYSVLSKEDFLLHQEDLSARTETEYTFSSAQTKDYVKHDDGSAVATFSDFNEADIATFLKLTGGIDDLFYDEYRVTALTVTFTTTPDSLPSQLTYLFTCEPTDLNTDPGAQSSTISMTTVFKDLDTLKKPEAFPLSSFTEVSDLRILENITYALDDRTVATEGAYRLELDQTLTAHSESQEYHEVDQGTFKMVEGSPTYRIEADVNGSSIEASYNNGIQTTVVRDGESDETTTTEMSDSDAWLFLSQQLNPGNFDSSYVTEIEVVDATAGIYKLTVTEPDLSLYDDLLTTATRTTSTCTYTMTYQDGKLTEYLYELSIKATTSRYGDVTVEASMKCTYIDTERESPAP